MISQSETTFQKKDAFRLEPVILICGHHGSFVEGQVSRGISEIKYEINDPHKQRAK